MAKQTFKFTTAEGRVATRQSARPYTHVVVTRLNLALLRNDIAARAGTHAARYNFQARIAALAVGDFWAPRCAVTETESKQAREFIAQYPTADSYVQSRIAAEIAKLNEQYGAGEVSRELVHQWSMSEKNAVKGLPNHPMYVGARVAPVDPT